MQILSQPAGLPSSWACLALQHALLANLRRCLACQHVQTPPVQPACTACQLEEVPCMPARADTSCAACLLLQQFPESSHRQDAIVPAAAKGPKSKSDPKAKPTGKGVPEAPKEVLPPRELLPPFPAAVQTAALACLQVTTLHVQQHAHGWPLCSACEAPWSIKCAGM